MKQALEAFKFEFSALTMIGGVFGGMFAYSLGMGEYLLLIPIGAGIGFLSGIVALCLPPSDA